MVEGRGVDSGASSWAAGEAGTEACGPCLCPIVYTCLTPETTVMECGGSRVCTRTLSLKVEVPGHLTWACLASPAELPAAHFPSRPNLQGCGQVTSWIMSPRNKEARLHGEGTLRF